jgi:hypothetical protein
MCTRQVAVTSAAEARIRWDANSSRTVQLARAASEDAVLALVRSVWSHILAALTQVRNSCTIYFFLFVHCVSSDSYASLKQS